MNIKFWWLWERFFKKLSKKDKILTEETIYFFRENPFHLSLRNHPLDPPLDKYRSISVDTDLRIIFRIVDDTTVLFIKVWTHEEMYERL